MSDDDLNDGERLQGRKADEVDVVELPEGPSSRSIWVLFLAGPTVWFLHFMAVYLVVEAVCTGGRPDRELLGLPLVSTFTLLATVAAVPVIAGFAVAAYRRWRDLERTVSGQSDDREEEETVARGHDRALAFAGFALGLLFILGVLFTGLPALWLTPC